METAKLDEKNKLDDLENVMDDNIQLDIDNEKELPENTSEILAGTIVKVPENWIKQSTNYVTTNNGLEVTDVKQVATVYAVAIGGGETVPVPYGFFYVGGNLSTGVVISDNEEDKYDSKVDKTTWEYAINLKGNQFVWIPCTKEKYKKTDWGLQNGNWDNITPRAEYIQIEKYGGFYIARYEAGLDESIPEFSTTQNNSSTNNVFNKNGIPQSKAGKIPWMFISAIQARKNAEKMYDTLYVSSGLVTGTQWDVMLNVIVDKTSLTLNDMKNSIKWGNYSNSEINVNGRYARCYFVNNNWYVEKFSTQYVGIKPVTINEGYILTTGASSEVQEYHIFDVAGNLFEWTDEIGIAATNGQFFVTRSGNAAWETTKDSACTRVVDFPSTDCHFSAGFRTVLYIK